MTVRTVPELLTDAGLADLLQVSTRTLQRLTKKPGFPRPLMVGTRRRWSKDAVLAYLRQQPRVPDRPMPINKTCLKRLVRAAQDPKAVLDDKLFAAIVHRLKRTAHWKKLCQDAETGFTARQVAYARGVSVEEIERAIESGIIRVRIGENGERLIPREEVFKPLPTRTESGDGPAEAAALAAGESQ